MATITVSNSNTNVDEGVVTGSTVNITGSNDTVTLDPGSTNDTVAITGSNDALAADGLSHSTITSANGNETITANGAGDTITVGDGSNTIMAGSHASITIGNGNDTVAAGANSTIGPGPHGDNGAHTVTAGPNSTVTLGDGNDLVFGGANSTITVGNGTATVHAGTSDNITIGHGADTILYDGLTPAFTVPKSLSVSEEHSTPLTITLTPPTLGNEVVTGFRTNQDEIELDTADFPNFAAVQANAKQVGANTVITQPGGAGTITLQNVLASSLSASNFTFFSGTGNDKITITGVPADETLSAGTKNADGSWTLTVAQLTGLQLNAGEPIGYPTPVSLGVSITNPAGQGASSGQTVPLTVNAIPPAVGVTAFADPGDPATETRLDITSATDDSDGGADYINRIQLSNVPSGVTLSSPGNTVTPDGPGTFIISTTGHPGSFNPEVDVFAPSGQSTNFNLGITAYSDEPNSPEQSTSKTQNIEVDYSQVAQTPDFTTTGQSIWNTGNAFIKNFSTFLGIDYPSGFPTTHGPASTSGSVLGVSLGATFGLKAGFQADLNINSGSFNASLPFNVTLNDYNNKTTNTVEIEPSDSQAGGGNIQTTGPGGSFELDLIFDVLAKAHGGPLSVTLSTNVFKTLIKKNSSTLAGSFNLPDGIGSVAFHWPQVNTTGSNPFPGPITSHGTSAPVFQVNIDPIAVVLDAILGDDPLKGSVGSAPLQLSYTILAATVAPGIDMQQAFSLDASGLTPTLKNGLGSTVPFNFGSPTILNNPASTSFNLGLTPDATLTNDTSLGAQLVVGLRALKASVTVGFPPVSTTGSIGPLIHVKTTFGPATLATLYSNTFPVNFNSKNIPFSVA